MSTEAQPANANVSPMMTRLLRAASWTLAGAVGSQVLGFVGGLLTARMLGGEGFGQLSAVRGLLLAFGLFSGAGLGLAAVRYVAEFRERDQARLRTRILFLQRLSWWCAILTASAVGILTPLMAGGWLGEENLRIALWLGCPLVLFNGLSAIQNGILGGLEKFRYIARGMAVESVGNLLGVVIGAKLAGVNGAVAGACIAGAIAWFYRHGLLRQEMARWPTEMSTPPGFDKAWLLHEAMPFILTGAITQPFEWYVRIMLVREPDGFAQLGLFTAALTCAQFVLFLPRQLTTPGVSLLAGMMASNTSEEVLSMAKLKLRTSWLLAAAVAIPMILLGDRILGWFGFSDGGEVLVMLVLAHLLGAYSLVFRSVLYAAGKVWVQCWQTLIWGVVLGAAGWCLRGFGAWGLATAYLLAFAVHIIFQGLAAGRWLQPEQVT
ncbi:MAG: oligosaccharide flippase family protein [Verrucomicrobiota bacterium]